MPAPTPEEAVEAARQGEERRLEAVRALARARQAVEETSTSAKQQRAELESQIAKQTAASEHAARMAWKAALKAGWSPTELRRIGFSAPSRRSATQRHSRPASSAVDDGDLGAPGQQPEQGTEVA